MDFRETIKENIFEKYSDKIEKNAEKYGYDQEVKTILKIVIPVVIQYYAEKLENYEQAEKLVFDNLENIHIVKSQMGDSLKEISDTYLPENFEKIEQANIVSEDILNRASGFYASVPEFKKENGEIFIQGIKRLLVYKSYGEKNKEAELGMLIHEMGHSIKGMVKEFNIQKMDNKTILLERSGLIETNYEVLNEKDKIILKLISEKNVGIEEGIQALEEEELMNGILYHKTHNKHQLPKECQEYLDLIEIEKYKTKGYSIQKTIASELLKENGLEKAIARQQLLAKGNIEQEYNSKFESEENHWQKLNERIDESVRMTYDKFSNIFNLDQWKKENGEREKENLNAIGAEIREYQKNREKIEAEEIIK